MSTWGQEYQLLKPSNSYVYHLQMSNDYLPEERVEEWVFTTIEKFILVEEDSSKN